MYEDINYKNLDQDPRETVGTEVGIVINLIEELKSILKLERADLTVLGLSRLKQALRLTYLHVYESKNLQKEHIEKFKLYLNNIYLMLYVLYETANKNLKPYVFYDSRNHNTNKKRGEYAICLRTEIPEHLCGYDGRYWVLDITFEKVGLKRRINFELLTINNEKRRREKEVIYCHESFRFDVIYGRFCLDLGTREESWEYSKKTVHYLSPMYGVWDDLFRRGYHFEESEFEEDPSRYPEFFDNTFYYYYGLKGR